MCEFTHLDSTSFHYDGKTNSDEEAPTVIHITKGYLRDYRPELSQVVLNLIYENLSGIPVYMQAQSVNINGVECFTKIVKLHISNIKAAQQCRYLVADTALYVKETIVELNAKRQLFVTRVPQKLKEAKILIQSTSLLKFAPICDGYLGVWHTSHYRKVERKRLLIRSEQATKREHQTLYYHCVSRCVKGHIYVVLMNIQVRVTSTEGPGKRIRCCGYRQYLPLVSVPTQ